jgi:hypothetical protein
LLIKKKKRKESKKERKKGKRKRRRTIAVAATPVRFSPAGHSIVLFAVRPFLKT